MALTRQLKSLTNLGTLEVSEPYAHQHYGRARMEMKLNQRKSKNHLGDSTIWQRWAKHMNPARAAAFEPLKLKLNLSV